MSSFSKAGKREMVREDKRNVKKHLKKMYQIMDTLEELSQIIHNEKEDWNEDNIEEVAARYTDITLGDMERFMLLGKLQNLKIQDEAADNSK